MHSSSNPNNTFGPFRAITKFSKQTTRQHKTRSSSYIMNHGCQMHDLCHGLGHSYHGRVNGRFNYVGHEKSIMVLWRKLILLS